MENYIKLIHKFEEILHPHINNEVLNKLKEDYKDVINSKRVFEKIIDIRTLLKVLEKRGVLQYDNISVLKYITQQLVLKESIELLISNYERWLKQNSKINNFYTFGKYYLIN
jgi:hypothetical protein